MNRFFVFNFSPFLLLLLIFAAISPNSAQNGNSQTGKNYQFTNGRWFDGKTFKKREFYSINAVFSDKKPAVIDETIDLKNGFVIPPFADAHTHNLDGVYNFDKSVNAYLKEGTFYVQVLGNSSSGAKQARAVLNKPSTLDVLYANGMLTCTYGHPFMVYEPLAMGIYVPAEAFRRIEEVKKSRLAEGSSYWFLDSKQDVDAKWDKILASKPDYLKIALIDAENYETLYKNGKAGDKGLSPEVAAYIIEKAHAAGKRVFAHIETANDFRLGLKIGVDVFAHASGYGWNGDEKTRAIYEVTDEDLKLAAKKKVVVIPTARIGEFYAGGENSGAVFEDKDARVKRAIERQKNLLNRMKKAGIIIAFGSDNFGHYLSDETDYLAKNKFFDNLFLLKTAVETTPQTIFPSRKIGRLANGYEASFLVLDGNPLNDFSQVKNINFRFKQGVIITVK